MQIAVLSGKGGTGKTFVSVNLAAAIEGAIYVDADVEEPNGFLFFRPEETREITVNRKVPVINSDKCDLCQECMRFCRYNAIALIGEKMEVFPELCHSCGGCSIVCPKQAIHEIDHPLGS
ncbi:MAG: 4Fe-4S binding protein, partial [Bacilli bacterium]|nr:4Fe-4S binding protein [Bacilli bacterium]